MQDDLFTDFYPHSPGFRRTDTSRAAAEAVKPKASFLQAKVLEALAIRPMTTAQIARHLGYAFEAVQPRSSELRAKDLIEDSGARGPSRDKSKLAIVWRLVPAKV